MKMEDIMNPRGHGCRCSEVWGEQSGDVSDSSCHLSRPFRAAAKSHDTSLAPMRLRDERRAGINERFGCREGRLCWRKAPFQTVSKFQSVRASVAFANRSQGRRKGRRIGDVPLGVWISIFRRLNCQ